MSKPALAIGLLATMVGAWYWALTPPPAQVMRPALAAAPMRRRRRWPSPRCASRRLGWLRQPDRRLPARNPFGETLESSAAGTQSLDPPPRAPGVVDEASGEVPEVSAWPRVDLIGVAEAREGDGLVRTAVVAGPRGVEHGRPGDVVAQVYRVERVGSDGVDVRLLPEDRILRLSLRP